jgi:predicted metal-dependent phosphotriesterase family hydrolase
MDVMTVRGPVAAELLGHLQTHEHVLIDLGRTAYRWDYEGLLNDTRIATEELAAYRSSGGTTICDVTPADAGRDPLGLVEISTRSDVHIVMGCGWYRWPYYPETIDRSSTTELAETLVTEIERGVGETGIRPGLIGEIGSDKAWVSGIEERVFRAAARAQATTGLGLMTHTPPGAALAQIEILHDAGAEPERIAIGHSDGLLDPDYHAAIRRLGAYLSFDLVGLPLYPDERRARSLVDLVRAGHLEWILLSTDICHRSRLRAWGGRGYAFLLESFLPRLRALGLDDGEIEMLTRDNPRRFLAGG